MIVVMPLDVWEKNRTEIWETGSSAGNSLHGYIKYSTPYPGKIYELTIFGDYLGYVEWGNDPEIFFKVGVEDTTLDIFTFFATMLERLEQ